MSTVWCSAIAAVEREPRRGLRRSRRRRAARTRRRGTAPAARQTGPDGTDAATANSPAQTDYPTSRSSRFISWISSRRRAASSNRRSRAASCISSVRLWIRRPSSSRGRSSRSVRAAELERPRPRPRPRPRVGRLVVAGAHPDHLEDVGDLLAHGLRIDAVLGVVRDLLLPAPHRLRDRVTSSSRSCGRRT